MIPSSMAASPPLLYILSNPMMISGYFRLVSMSEKLVAASPTGGTISSIRTPVFFSMALRISMFWKSPTTSVTSWDVMSIHMVKVTGSSVSRSIFVPLVTCSAIVGPTCSPKATADVITSTRVKINATIRFIPIPLSILFDSPLWESNSEAMVRLSPLQLMLLTVRQSREGYDGP